MYKPEISADATAGDALNNADNATIDYDKITADAIQSHNDIIEPLENVVSNLETLDSNRSWFSENIVTPAGDIIIPQLFPTAADKIKLLEQADKYFATANESEKNLRTLARSLQATLGRNAALTLTTEVHRLTHQGGEVGDLLRDLDGKGLLKVAVIPKPNKGEHTISFSPDADTEDDDEKRVLLDQASESLRATMGAYLKDTLKSMIACAFEDQTDESVWPYTSFYLLYTNKFRSVREMNRLCNMQLFATTMLASLNDSVNKYKKVESDFYALVDNAVEAYNNAQNSSQE